MKLSDPATMPAIVFAESFIFLGLVFLLFLSESGFSPVALVAWGAFSVVVLLDDVDVMIVLACRCGNLGALVVAAEGTTEIAGHCPWEAVASGSPTPPLPYCCCGALAETVAASAAAFVYFDSLAMTNMV